MEILHTERRRCYEGGAERDMQMLVLKIRGMQQGATSQEILVASQVDKTREAFFPRASRDRMALPDTLIFGPNDRFRLLVLQL